MVTTIHNRVDSVTERATDRRCGRLEGIGGSSITLAGGCPNGRRPTAYPYGVTASGALRPPCTGSADLKKEDVPMGVSKHNAWAREIWCGSLVQDLPHYSLRDDPLPDPRIARTLAKRVKQKERQREKATWAQFRRLFGDVAEASGAAPEYCVRSRVLRRRAQKIVKLLQVEQSLKAVRPLPSDFVCGTLRSKIRSMYEDELTLVQLLSIKTSAKAELKPCSYCEGLQEEQLENWKRERHQPVDIDNNHLLSFGRAFAENVPKGWNSRKTIYIPNGHATKESARKDGGNWVQSEISDSASIMTVVSAGKLRTITLFSEGNIATLTPLHNSLYSHLKGRNWLLVGSPTNEKVQWLRDGTSGNRWLSFDYEAATDNIKSRYVEEAVNILINKGDGLSDDEIRCLRILSQFSLGDLGAVTKCQPMGSPMSFPLLCMINKTVVDMALTDLLLKGEISFNEWTSHRCLINGDDLLTRSTSKGDLVAAVVRQGSPVGLITNRDKTLDSPDRAEINSTVFKDCVEEKKTNVSALWMSAEVTDTLGFAQQSCVTSTGFRRVVLNNVSRLARQKTKTYAPLPYSLKLALLRTPRLKTALLSRPSGNAPSDTNLFPVVTVGPDYCLSREEQDAALSERIARIREGRLYSGLPAEKKRNKMVRKDIAILTPTPTEMQKTKRKGGVMSLLKPNKPTAERRVLSIFAAAWNRKRKEELFAVEMTGVTSTTVVSDLNRVEAMLDEIKAFKVQKKLAPMCDIPSGPTPCLPNPESQDFGWTSSWVSLS